MTDTIRLDRFLVEAGLMDSRSEALAAIEAGRVSVNGRTAAKASLKVSHADQISAEKAHPYVSRAALKLKSALDVFPVTPAGKTCLDIGSSTGGFTEVLLEAGAVHVFAVDVGTDQLHARLRTDPRISLFEQTDARRLTNDQITVPIDLLVCDASFIGLEKVLQPGLSFLVPGGDAILLFKPQFQVGPKAVGKGGIVSDQDAIETATQDFTDWIIGQGFSVQGWAPSPVTGSDGNQEWLVWVRQD